MSSYHALSRLREQSSSPRLLSCIGLLSLFLFCSLSTSSLGQDAALIRLAELVQVCHDGLLLSDLLPSEASPALRQRAATVYLGRAPGLGSTRVLEAREIERLLPKAGGEANIAVPPRVTIQRTGWPIARGNLSHVILQYFKTRRWGTGDFAADRVWWDEGFTTVKADASLEVVAVTSNLSAGTLDLKLRCVSRADCTPFLVRLPLPDGPGAKERQAIASVAESGEPPIRRPDAAGRSDPLLVKAGEPSILRNESVGIRISVTVMPLQRGVLGQRIRVRDPATQRIFVAQVVGERQLNAIPE